MFTQLAYEFNKNPQLDDDEGYEEIPTVKCPFDASHMMQPKNFLTHVYRCKSPNKHLYVQCRYDPCHWIYPENKAQHHQNCPTRLEHYLDMDLIEGDWDDDEIQKKMQEKAMKEQHVKRKKKILKIIAYLKLKKRLEKQEQNFSHKKVTSTTRQNESDASITYSEIKQKLKNYCLKKKYNKELDISRAQTEGSFEKNQNKVFQQAKTCINGGYPMSMSNFHNPFQFMQYPSPMEFYEYKNFYPSFQQNFQPNFQSTSIGLQPYHQQFQPFGYKPNMMLPSPPSFSGPNHPQKLPPQQYQLMAPANQFSHAYSYQQQLLEYQNSVPVRLKPEPQKSLKFQVSANTEDFIKKNIKDDDQKSQAKTKVSSQADTRSDTQTFERKQIATKLLQDRISTSSPLDLHERDSKNLKKYHVNDDEKYESQKKNHKQNQNKDKKKKQMLEDSGSKEESKQRKRKSEKKSKKNKKQNRAKDKKEKSKSKSTSKTKDKQQHKKDTMEEIVLKDRQRGIQKQKQMREKEIKYNQKYQSKHRILQSMKNNQPNYQEKKNQTHQNFYSCNPHLYQNPQYQNQHVRESGKKQIIQNYQVNYSTSIPLISGLSESGLFKKKNQTNTVGNAPKFEPILDKSISTYDFSPFNFSINATIKNKSFQLIHEKSQDSMDMKEMLSILDEKRQTQKYKEKSNQFKLDSRNFAHNQGSQKRRDYGGY